MHYPITEVFLSSSQKETPAASGALDREVVEEMQRAELTWDYIEQQIPSLTAPNTGCEGFTHSHSTSCQDLKVTFFRAAGVSYMGRTVNSELKCQ